MMSPGQVLFIPTLLLAMLVAGQRLWSWSEREAPSARIAVPVG